MIKQVTADAPCSLTDNKQDVSVTSQRKKRSCRIDNIFQRRPYGFAESAQIVPHKPSPKLLLFRFSASLLTKRGQKREGDRAGVSIPSGQDGPNHGCLGQCTFSGQQRSRPRHLHNFQPFPSRERDILSILSSKAIDYVVHCLLTVPSPAAVEVIANSISLSITVLAGL